MRRSLPTSRLVLFGISLFLCSLLIVFSSAGSFSTVEGVAAIPLNFLSGIFNTLGLGASSLITDISEIQNLRERNAELEEALAQFQPEIVQLREINSDYQRLASLLDYSSAALNQQTIAAEVINYDQSSLLRTIVVNRGVRDGISRGMPVVTGEGLIGRISDVFATTSRVLLITDPTSSVSARLQTTRAQGSIVGLLSGDLRMDLIPLGAEVQVGDIVITSGLGGNFPPDLAIGQVESVRQFEFELNQTAEVRSLVDFNTLEFVLIITNFQPVNLAAFDEER